MDSKVHPLSMTSRGLWLSICHWALISYISCIYFPMYGFPFCVYLWFVMQMLFYMSRSMRPVSDGILHFSPELKTSFCFLYKVRVDLRFTPCSVGTSVGEKQGHRLPHLHGRASPVPHFWLLSHYSQCPDALDSLVYLMPVYEPGPGLGKPSPLCLPGSLQCCGPGLPPGKTSSSTQPREMRWPSQRLLLGFPSLHSFIHSFNHLLTIHWCAGVSQDDASAWGFWRQRPTPNAPCLSQELAHIWWMKDEWTNKEIVWKTSLNSNFPSLTGQTNIKLLQLNI